MSLFCLNEFPSFIFLVKEVLKVVKYFEPLKNKKEAKKRFFFDLNYYIMYMNISHLNFQYCGNREHPIFRLIDIITKPE